MNYLSIGKYHINLDRVNYAYQVKQRESLYLYIECGDSRPIAIPDPEGAYYKAFCRKVGLLPHE